MNQQSKNKTWIIVIAVLLLANVVLLSIFLTRKTETKKSFNDRDKPMAAYLKKELGFTDSQLNSFDTIRNQHRQEVKQVFDRLRAGKTETFKALGAKGFTDSALIEAATFSASQQKEIELKLLTHLRDIRNLCTPEQRQKFDTGFYKVMTRGKDGRDKKKEK